MGRENIIKIVKTSVDTLKELMIFGIYDPNNETESFYNTDYSDEVGEIYIQNHQQHKIKKAKKC